MDSLCVNTIRCLAADMVQQANSGHPGAPVGIAPMAHILFSRFMNVNPKDYTWANRDRFVLSNGHASALHYVLLHLLGVEDCSMDQLKNFRQLHSKTPGHPERGLTTGVEMTTGPLGQGISAAVGMAIARNHIASKFNKPEFSLINHNIYAIAGDGCLQEGVAFESCSLAGHLGLEGLIVFYDDNNITIDGRTDVSFTENVPDRFRALGWEVIVVEKGDSDFEAIATAIQKATQVTEKPVLIDVKTTIGFGAPTQNTSKAHGAPFGDEGIQTLKKFLGMPENEKFYVPEEVHQEYQKVISKGEESHRAWISLFDEYKQQFPALGAEFERRLAGKIPFESTDELYQSLAQSVDAELFSKSKATRETSHQCINSIAGLMPEVLGGSADLAASNKTDIKGETFMTTQDFSPRNIRFGVREHGMAAVCNGIAAYGLIRPFCATFMVFAGYMMGSIRLAALSHLPVVYVLTHDSLAVGEDGATHMPVGELSQLREMPNLKVYRPCDLRETMLAYASAFSETSCPSVIIGSRQGIFPVSSLLSEAQLEQYRPSVFERNGCIVVKDHASPSVVVLASGSETGMVMEALRDEAEVKVISVPHLEKYFSCTNQLEELAGKAVLSVELATPGKWYLLHKYAERFETMSVETYGLSGKASDVLKWAGFTKEAVKEKVRALGIN
ncbi:hypothetical protein GEMRC1_013051 [Eukaryota sp. GEM-RC1]